jgi:hypothetical protein
MKPCCPQYKRPIMVDSLNATDCCGAIRQPCCTTPLPSVTVTASSCCAPVMQTCCPHYVAPAVPVPVVPVVHYTQAECCGVTIRPCCSNFGKTNASGLPEGDHPIVALSHPDVVESIVPQGQCCEFKLPCCTTAVSPAAAAVASLTVTQSHCCEHELSCCTVQHTSTAKVHAVSPLHGEIANQEHAMLVREKAAKTIELNLARMSKKLAASILAHKKAQKAALTHDIKVVDSDLAALKKQRATMLARVSELSKALKESAPASKVDEASDDSSESGDESSDDESEAEASDDDESEAESSDDGSDDDSDDDSEDASGDESGDKVEDDADVKQAEKVLAAAGSHIGVTAHIHHGEHIHAVGIHAVGRVHTDASFPGTSPQMVASVQSVPVSTTLKVN